MQAIGQVQVMGGSVAKQPKESGLRRLKQELDEIQNRIAGASVHVSEAASQLFGPTPENVEGAIPPSADTIDSRLGDIRRALSCLESNIARLHQS